MNLCECLIGKVALRGICEDAEACVFYINDLPGLSISAFDMLKGAEAKTYKKAYEAVEKEAIRRLQTDIKTKIRSKFKVSHEGKSKIKRTGRFIKPFEITETENCLIGSYFPLFRSDYMTLNGIVGNFYSQIDQTITLYIFDTESGELIETIEVDAKEGLNRIEFPKGTCYSSYDGIFIAYDANALISRKVEGVNDSCGCLLPSCMTCACKAEGFYKFCYDSEPSESEVCVDDLEKSDSGIWFKYYTECSFEKWMCCYVDELCEILRMGIAVQFFLDIEGQFGKANKLTLVPKENRDELADHYKDQYDEMIGNFLSGIEGDCCCFKCDEMFSIGKIKP